MLEHLGQPHVRMSDKADSSNDRKQKFEEIELEARVLAEAYRRRLLGRLWWANLVLIVLPAVCVTAAAILAAGGAGIGAEVSKYVAAGLAGLAAVLTAIHKSLRCEEYQAECLRLGSAYDAIAVRAGSAQAGTCGNNPTHDELKDLTEEFATLKGSAKAPLPSKYITEAEQLYQVEPVSNPPKNANGSLAPKAVQRPWAKRKTAGATGGLR